MNKFSLDTLHAVRDKTVTEVPHNGLSFSHLEEDEQGIIHVYLTEPEAKWIYDQFLAADEEDDWLDGVILKGGFDNAISRLIETCSVDGRIDSDSGAVRWIELFKGASAKLQEMVKDHG